MFIYFQCRLCFYSMAFVLPKYIYITQTSHNEGFHHLFYHLLRTTIVPDGLIHARRFLHTLTKYNYQLSLSNTVNKTNFPFLFSSGETSFFEGRKWTTRTGPKAQFCYTNVCGESQDFCSTLVERFLYQCPDDDLTAL